MKKLILMTALCIFSLNSFADSKMSCSDIYQDAMVMKQIKKKKMGNVAYKMAGAGFFISLGAPAVGLALFVPGIGLELYASMPSQEERINRLLETGNSHLIKFTKKVQKEISPDISAEEVLGVLRENFENGYFCKNAPDLYSPSEVKNHVRGVLQARYGN